MSAFVINIEKIYKSTRLLLIKFNCDVCTWCKIYFCFLICSYVNRKCVGVKYCKRISGFSISTLLNSSGLRLTLFISLEKQFSGAFFIEKLMQVLKGLYDFSLEIIETCDGSWTWRKIGFLLLSNIRKFSRGVSLFRKFSSHSGCSD